MKIGMEEFIQRGCPQSYLEIEVERFENELGTFLRWGVWKDVLRMQEGPSSSLRNRA